LEGLYGLEGLNCKLSGIIGYNLMFFTVLTSEAWICILTYSIHSFFSLQLSVNKMYGTFGQQLLNVRYGGQFNKNKAYLFAVLTVGSKYLKWRSHEIATATRNHSMSEKVRKCLCYCCTGTFYGKPIYLQINLHLTNLVYDEFHMYDGLIARHYFRTFLHFCQLVFEIRDVKELLSPQ
jgi:hypothetical protein